jgi:peptidyl-tRNA hydrolase, PTH1 family
MKLVIGLGNPGEKYKYTRHNVGFIILDELRTLLDFPDFTLEKKFQAEITEKKINNEKVILAKPQTLMNLSGKSARAILDFYNLNPKDIIVIHDDIDIEPEKVKVTEDSGPAGHHGVKSIIDSIGTQKFKRFRIGILGNEKRNKLEVLIEDFVLQQFSDEELEIIKSSAQQIKQDLQEEPDIEKYKINPINPA